jgi:hypothetical protein
MNGREKLLARARLADRQADEADRQAAYWRKQRHAGRASVFTAMADAAARLAQRLRKQAGE